ncbi:PREDICTED: sushi, von Willebrand factor type A, EGF and pentraxin domain-containing protein 1-like isoform X2 [Acropora digitifera]|uniref:sushi, von Willebrand factor type A, EGF and pentraxin domain-containing protein 1-like isoform X2 n=1 Tax=Acropora digitifera TaxID=70779 RepID=UPI00077A10B4|nr:PREDICTED: sushi, von Willebrand factor type A, EGF and pentraxin domain-containing protein 1-like isoform X2 [Acropora digitifera]
MRMWKRALTFAVLVFICPNIECKKKKDDSKKSVDCRRTNKSAFRFCTKACKSHNDCKKNQRCLCDGDCGMSCVRNNLKCNELKKTKNLIAKVSNGRSFGSVITYSCPSPFTLRGPSKRSCRAIGEWDGRKTRCRKFCRDPGEITHGNRRYTSFQVGKYITYWCFPGYNMTGNARITCEEDRSTGNPRWSSNKPICQLPTCPRPTIPRNALIDFPRKMPKNFNYNQRVLLKCMYGYVKTSLGILACRGPSWIGGISCRPKSCGSPNEVANGRILGYLYTFKQRVTYACDEGYQIRGPLYRQCQANGKWGGDDPSCDVVNCGPLQRPDHGDIIQQVGTTFGNRIVFECTEKGYEIRGSKVRTCQSDGSWSGLPTTCELVKCDDPGTPVNGMRIVSKGLVYGGSLRFKCNRDYTLMKGMSEIIYCQATKRWTASVPQCLAPCGDPGLPRQGNRIGDDFRHGSKVIFTCPNNYLMEGVGEISCSNGTWSNSVPTCKGICGRPRISSRGPLHLHGNSFLDGDEVQFSCIANYDLFGSQKSRCVGRRWNTGIPECKARCIFGGGPDNGFAVRNAFSDRMVKHGLQIVYRCNEQYTLIGSATQRCNNGRWTNSRPSCKAHCRDPGVPHQGNRIGDDFRHGSKVIFTCRDDYIVEGVGEISCSNGRWSNRVPTCKAPCAKLSKPANGYMRGDFRHGSQVRFGCLSQYQRIGAASSTCNDGTWSNSAPICKGICGRPRISSRGPLHLHGNSFLDGDEVQFSCVGNYDLFGSQRSRCVGQRWNTGIPECKARCIFGGDPGNGFAVRNAFFKRMVKHGLQIVYHCNEHYALIGSATQECNNGQWTNARPSCKGICERPIVPSRGPLILHGNSFLDGDEVQFSCVANYDLFGSQRSRCVGQKWNNRKPECKARCLFGGDPDNGFAVRNAFFNRTVKHGLQIVYRCNEQYTLIGSATQECNNGQWTNARPSCKGTCGRPIIPSKGPLILLGNSFLDGDEVQFSCVANYDLFGSQRSRCNGQKWNTSIPECKARCIFGGDPDNGFAVRNAFFKRMVKHGVQIVYRCFIHYTLIGSANQECNNGRWTTARPSCKGTCGRPIVPLRGPLILHGNSFLDGDEVKFSCVANYDLFGSQRSRCFGQKWNTGMPECKARCIFGGDPDNGFAVRNAFFNRMVKHGLQIVYRCNKHYALIGSATQECNNGQWTSTRPSCKAPCRDPGVPRQGNRIGDDFRHGSKVIFTCPNKYLMEGVGEISCSNGTWSNRVPTCKAPCVQFPRPANGYMHGDFRHGNQVRFGCYYGYQMIGAASSTCNDGAWSNSAPICKGICGRPRISSRGPLHLHGNSFLDGDEVQFSCIANYDLFGSQKSRCVGRRWNTGIPECKARCIFGGDPDNGFAVRNTFSHRMVKHGLQIVYRCNEQYTLIGSATQRCNNGHWTNSRPSCKASCRRPEPPMNGGMRGDNFNHNEKVVFYCDENYQLAGQSQITCKDGSWSDLFPKCIVVNCGPLQRPDHGNIVEIVGTTFGNRIVFECIDKGYEIRGSKVRTCQSNSSWSGLPTTCELVKCDDPGTPVNGMRIVSKGLVYGGSLRFKCNRDYTLMKGMSEIIYCQANKRWTASVPHCLAPCRDPGVPRQGSRIGDDFRHGGKVIFSCPNNYLMEGVGEIRCSNGTWSSSVPTCKAPCAKLSKPANGYMRGDFRHGNQVRFVCYYRYQRIGAASSTCNDGTWSNSAPICKGICGRPRVSSRVHVHGNSFLDGDEVQFSCIANYDLFGSQRSRCVGQRWNTGIPECKARCIFGGDPHKGFAVRDAFFNRVVNHGVQITYRCNENFTLIGSATQECNNGHWTNSRPSCKASCQWPGRVDNGRKVGHSYKHGDTVQYVCNNGYILDGKQNLTCADGVWSSNRPACRVTCSNPGEPAQGRRWSNNFQDGSSVVFECDDGFDLFGNKAILCRGGSWNASIPECKAPCVKLSRPANGYMSGDFKHRNQVRFVCYYGYQRIGAASSTCNDGTWSNSAPICKGRCGRPRVSSRGPLKLHGNSFLDGDELQFSCIANYDLFGSQRIRCVGRRWNTGIPECKARCIFGGDPDNGFAVRNAFSDRMVKHGLQIVYRCNEHYTLIGSATQRCNNGRWTNSRPSCKAPCQDPGVPRQGSRTGDDFRHGRKVSFTCQDDYLMEGVREISCSNGAWSNRVPTCKAPCIKLSRPANGYMSGDFRHGNQVRFVCYYGYQRIGAASSTCNDGTWSNSAPICKGICGRPIVPLRGPLILHGNSFLDGDEVQFSCIANYDLFGSQRSRCVVRKWNTRIPKCKGQCVLTGDSPQRFPSERRRLKHGSSLKFSCNESHSLIGSSIVHCIDGKWNASFPSCKDYSGCGESLADFRARIVGGNSSRRGWWPWQVAVKKYDNGNFKLHCGGALIAPQWVLTAAHCFYLRNEFSGELELRKNGFRVSAGEYRLNQREKSQQDISPEKIVPHDKYVKENYLNDIALIKLENKVELGRFVRTVCLPSKEKKDLALAKKYGYVSGWGTKRGLRPRIDPKPADYPNQLRHASFQIQDNTICQNSTEHTFEPDAMFCAGDGKGGSDSCKGDSGGAFVRKRKIGDRYRWVAAGIVSWGEGCAQRDKYGFYTRVYSYIDWIGKTMAEN